MDQIDYYVYSAKKGAKEATNQVQKVMERETSKRSQYCITCLVQCIMVCVVFLGLKHM